MKSELAQFSEEYEEKVDDSETLDMLTGALESLDDAIDLFHDALLKIPDISMVNQGQYKGSSASGSG